MAWQAVGSGGYGDEEIKCGALNRPSQKQNPLLVKPELGKVKPVLFNRPDEEHAFGYAPPRDPEGAREVTTLWTSHRASPSTKPAADFKAMNKLAADSGLTSAKELPAFRSTHQVAVRSPPPKDLTPKLPSNRDPTHVYGLPASHRSAESVRFHGPMEPPIKHLVQGAYQEDWVVENLEKESHTLRGRPYIPPVPTKAALGHSAGAARYTVPPNPEEPFKMSKFKTVGPKVTAHMGGPNLSGKVH